MKIFRDEAQKFRVLYGGIACLLILGVTSIVGGVFILASQVKDLNVKQSAAFEEAKTQAVKAITTAQEGRDLIDQNLELNKLLWETLERSNPQLAVPQVVEQEPEERGQRSETRGPRERRREINIIVPSPAPSVAPTPKVIRVPGPTKYVPRPTPWPWWKARPTPTPKKRR
jgi:hypothetical protein